LALLFDRFFIFDSLKIRKLALLKHDEKEKDPRREVL